jgi:hypothetical protein
MLSPKIEEFARKLVAAVRDQAIESCDGNVRPSAQNVVAKRWHQANVGKETEVTVPDTVDEALFFLLTAIDQGAIRLSYTADDGESVDLSKAGLGELAGWYVGPGGWIEQHSVQRHFASVPDEDAT